MTFIDDEAESAQDHEKTEKSEKVFKKIRAVFEAPSASFAHARILELAEQSNWDVDDVCNALKMLDKVLSLDQILEIVERSGYNYKVADVAFTKLEGALSLEQFFDIAKRVSWNADVLSPALQKMYENLSLDQILEIVEKSGRDRVVAHYAFKKLEGTLSVHQILEIAEQMGGSPDVLHRALKKVRGTFSNDQFYQLAELAFWDDITVSEGLKKLGKTLSLDQLLEIARNTNWKYRVSHEALKKLGEILSIEFVHKEFIKRGNNENEASDIILRLLADNLDTSLDYTELISELAQKYPRVLLVNLENFQVADTTQIAITLLKNDNYGLVVDHLSHFPQKDWAEIIRLLMRDDLLEHKYLASLLPYIDFIDEQTKNDIFSKLLQLPNPAFFPELLENETPRAVGQFGSFSKEDQLIKLAQLKEGRFYKALLVLIKTYGYSAEQVGFAFEDILSEIQILINHANYAHLFDLISLAVLLFPEKETELQNIRETFSSGNSSPTEQPQPRETFVQFDALQEIFEYYAMITLEGRYNIDLLPHSLTRRITDKINILFEKIKEYIIVAVSSELRNSRDFKTRLFGNHGNFLYKFGTPEEIRMFFERAKSNFSIASQYADEHYGGQNWATIADFGAQFWVDSAQNDLSTKITLLNLAVSLQHNSGYFFNKDYRISLENDDLRELLDFEAGGERTFESFLEYGLENNILSQEEYAEYVQLNNTLSSTTDQLPTRVDSNQIYLRQMVQEAKKQIEAIQNNPAIPFEIKMETQAVFSKTEGFSRKENYRLYLSNLLKTISINWENVDDTIKRFQSGNQTIYHISIAGYDLAYWYEDGKLITIHSMDELKQQRQKLSQLLNQPIVAAQFGYVREGD